MKHFLTAVVSAMLIFAFIPTPHAASDDINGHEFETELRLLVNGKIMGGYQDGTIKPDNAVTRAEFAKLVGKSLQLQPVLKGASSGGNPFTDVNNGDWYYTDVMLAVEAGIINGYPDHTFKPNNEISRQEMAAMINRALDNKNFKKESESVQLNFKDIDKINPVFIEDIQGVVAAGVMNGYGNNTFGPTTNTTRGQVAAVLTRTMNITDPAEEPKEPENPSEEPGETPEEPEEPVEEPEEIVEEPEDLLDPPESPIEEPTVPKDPPTTPEPPKDLNFIVATLNSSGETSVVDEYDTFTSARDSLANNQVILKGSKVVYMKPGTGIAAANKYAEIYANNALSGGSITYVSGGTELKYLDATEEAVKVEIANTVGYVKAESMTLIPNEMSTGRSTYKVIGSELYHSLYNPITKERAAILLGAAPSFMSQGTEYYSWDAVNFTTSSGTKTAYSYFMFVPLHTTSNYSAADLDRYLAEMYPKTNELPESPLVGTGEFYKKMEEKYSVNALYLMAHAIHESNWGKSKIAQDKNNLYGMQAVDRDAYNQAIEYESFEASIEDAAMKVSTRYQTPGGKHYNGAVLGNKGIGMNVKYASDPYWGEKISGHMYRADKHLGKKDSNQHTLAYTNVENLRVRTGAGTNNPEIYRINKVGTPVIYTETTQTDGATWYKIRTDDAGNRTGYVYGNGSLGQYVKEMPVAR